MTIAYLRYRRIARLLSRAHEENINKLTIFHFKSDEHGSMASFPNVQHQNLGGERNRTLTSKLYLNYVEERGNREATQLIDCVAETKL